MIDASVSIQSIQITDTEVSIQYVEEGGLDRSSGIIEAKMISIPHEVLPTSLLTDLVDSAQSILEEARVIRRKPAESFKAPR